MDLIFNLLRGALYILSYALPIIFVFKLIVDPEWLDCANFSNRQEIIACWICVGAGISLGIILYMGLDRAFSFIPESWALGTDEGGEPRSVRGILAGFLSFVSTVYIMLAVIGYRLNNYRKKMALKDKK